MAKKKNSVVFNTQEKLTVLEAIYSELDLELNDVCNRENELTDQLDMLSEIMANLRKK